jgi:hypothetical protein
VAGPHRNLPALREETREGAIMTSIEHPIISALHAAARATTAYPVDLLAARRADFRAKIEARSHDRTCKYCGDPARSYVPIYTGPEGLAIDRLAGPTIDLSDSHVDRWSDMYRFESAQPVAPWTAAAWQAGDCEDVPTPRVSEADDERNSRPLPY